MAKKIHYTGTDAGSVNRARPTFRFCRDFLNDLNPIFIFVCISAG